jgi:hypothetical protein
MLQCAKGDQGAFDALFERYKASVYEYLACSTGDASLAEDVGYLIREMPAWAWLFPPSRVSL